MECIAHRSEESQDRSRHGHQVRECALRDSIARRECYCTTEVFLWSSIVYQPLPLVEATIKGRVWQRPVPLAPSERVPVTAADGPGPAPVRPAVATEAVE